MFTCCRDSKTSARCSPALVARCVHTFQGLSITPAMAIMVAGQAIAPIIPTDTTKHTTSYRVYSIKEIILDHNVQHHQQ